MKRIGILAEDLAGGCLVTVDYSKKAGFPRIAKCIYSVSPCQIILWLSAPENLNAIQGNLCKLASSEFGKLRDRPCSSINDLNSQWPLLLLFQNTDHIETLFSTKMSPTRGRNTSDQAFTTAQARCYGIIK